MAFLRYVMYSGEVIINSSRKLSNWFSPDSIHNSSEEVGNEIAKTFAIPPKFKYSPGILNDLISSGNLNKIKNENLRKYIQEWLIVLQEIKEQEDELWDHRSNVMQLMNEKISFKDLITEIGLIDSLEDFKKYSKFKSDNTKILKERYFENLLFFYLVIVNEIKHSDYSKALNIINSILNEIENEL